MRKNVKIDMKRLLYKNLLDWKKNPNRKPLILNGARQVGKTWLLRNFGFQEYESVAYINCESTTNINELFADFDTKRIIRALSAYTNVDIVPNDSLIILDEVQQNPRILTALKYFCEEAPQYHIAVAGSLLGIALHQGISYPVGKVDELNLYPMNFDEFLMALDKKQAYDALHSGDWSLINSLSNVFIELLRQYYYVGGMPAVVKAYIDGLGLQEIRNLQKQILRDYTRDFSKHTQNREVTRINLVWDQIPQQLAKENKKFFYSNLKPGGRAKDYEIAIQWLLDSGLIYKVNRVSQIRKPLRFYEEPLVFKLFTLDVGLLGAQMDTAASDVLISNNGFVEYKGAFSEQFFLTQLLPIGIPIRYFSSNTSRVEIDFVIQTEQEVIPVEVKAEQNVYSKSLITLLGKRPDLHALRFSLLPHSIQRQIENVPLYAVSAFFEQYKKIMFPS